MPAVMARKRTDYAGPLLALIGRKRSRGRPKALDWRDLLRDIADINNKNRQLTSRRSIARILSQRPAYQDIGIRILERGVESAVADMVEMLSECPPASWQKIFGIAPPAEMTKQALRKKAFELMRRLLSLVQK